MSNSVKISVHDGDLTAALRTFLRSVLNLEAVEAILVAQQMPMKNRVMPMLVHDPERLEAADPLAPAFPLNGAKLVSRLTRKSSGAKIAAVLRPCEIRAFVELVKLKQGRREDVIVIGTDCLGALSNSAYFRFAGEDAAGVTTEKFVRAALSGDGMELAPACSVCEHPVPEGADVVLGLFGVDTGDHLMAQAMTPEGQNVLDRLDLPAAPIPDQRSKAIDALVSRRIEARDAMFARTREATGTLEDLTRYLANCVNCYNCRVACPVCYCRECVFVTDVFDHEPLRYLRWAERKGALKMPTDTVFYHLTRLAHMSTACVGCGQCSNACPNDIPVMELFRTVAHGTQAAFGYRAGRSLEEKPPLSEFREKEFAEVVGIGN